ncbi:hypothetical protein D0862_02838, partial [Hortaea werneckii]
PNKLPRTLLAHEALIPNHLTKPSSTCTKAHATSAWTLAAGPGKAMIRRAKREALFRNLTHRTTFLTVELEHCGDVALLLCQAGFEPNTINLITVAMAAHWFQLPAFYLSAARALRPGGTLAIWTTSSYFCHPSVPGYREIQTLLHTLEDEMLVGQYYDHLPLRWTLLPADANADGSSNPSAGLLGEATFEREYWDRDGVPSGSPLPDGSPASFLLGREVDLQGGLKAFDSSGPVIRWREANPEKANTDLDPTRIIADRLKQVVGEPTKLVVAPACTVLLFRRT